MTGQIFRQTSARALLLVVALGYGIVRPRLLPSEWASVLAVALVYFAAGVPLPSSLTLTDPH